LFNRQLKLDSGFGAAEQAYLDVFTAVGTGDSNVHRLLHYPLDYRSHRGVNVIQPALKHIHAPQCVLRSVLLGPG